MKIWAVSSGDYSDYSVLCVCRTEGLANAIVDKLNYGSSWKNYDTQAISFYNEMPVVVDELVIEGEVDPDNDAWSGHETHETWIEGHEPRPPQPCQHDLSVSSSYRSNDQRHVVHISVRGIDHERVRKTFSEQLAYVRAEAPLLIARSIAEAAQREAKYLRARVDDLTSKQGYGTLGS